MLMSMTHMTELRLFEDLVELEFPMTVGAAFVDPRLIEFDAAAPDTEELIAFRTSCV
jgi:hypothetical protein